MGVVGKPYLCMKSYSGALCLIPSLNMLCNVQNGSMAPNASWGLCSILILAWQVVGELQNSITLQWYQQPLAPANGSVPAGSRRPVLILRMSKYVRKAASCLRATPLSQQADKVAHAGPKDFQRLLTSSLAVMMFGSRFHDWFTILPGGSFNSFRRIQGQTWLAPYRLKAVIQHLLPLHLVVARMGFTPTGWIISSISERNINLGMQTLPRLKAIL